MVIVLANPSGPANQPRYCSSPVCWGVEFGKWTRIWDSPNCSSPSFPMMVTDPSSTWISHHESSVFLSRQWTFVPSKRPISQVGSTGWWTASGKFCRWRIYRVYTRWTSHWPWECRRTPLGMTQKSWFFMEKEAESFGQQGFGKCWNIYLLTSGDSWFNPQKNVWFDH